MNTITLISIRIVSSNGGNWGKKIDINEEYDTEKEMNHAVSIHLEAAKKVYGEKISAYSISKKLDENKVLKMEAEMFDFAYRKNYKKAIDKGKEIIKLCDKNLQKEISERIKNWSILINEK